MVIMQTRDLNNGLFVRYSDAIHLTDLLVVRYLNGSVNRKAVIWIPTVIAGREINEQFFFNFTKILKK
jgi:hypothetical protein